MAFKRINPDSADPAVKKWVQVNRNTPGLHAASYSGKTYILVSRGEKPNAGYRITITNVVEEINQVAVYTAIQDPQPGMMYAQVLTTPIELVVIPQTQKPVKLLTKI